MEAAEDRVEPEVRSASRVAVQCAVLCGGVAALSWEVLWQLESALALGISALGTALTLATTMLGMALGAVGAGRLLRARSVASPLRPAYGGLGAFSAFSRPGSPGELS